MIRAFLFDIGRVLVHFDFSRCFRQLAPLAAADMTLAEQEIRALLTPLETGLLSDEEFTARCVTILGGGVTPEVFTRAYTSIFEPNTLMEPVVAALADKYPLYLFSNTSGLHERALLASMPVFRHFRGGFFSWRAGVMKPDAPAYEQAIALTGEPPEHIAYIDDAAANIAAGAAAGLQTHEYAAERHDAFTGWLRTLGAGGE
jgi:glucose-1-phosphatase